MMEKMFKIEDGILLEYHGTEESVKIPAGVKKIGYDAFHNNEYIKTVFIPEGVVSICDFAFTGCINLIGISFPSTLQRIGYSAFSECSKLASVGLPDGLKLISARAFMNCKRLFKINIPNGATVEGGAFFGCSLTDVDFDGRTNFATIEDSSLRAVGNRCILCGGLMELSDDHSGMTCSECRQNFTWNGIDEWENFVFRDGVCVQHIGGGGSIPDGTKKIGCGAFDDGVVHDLSIPESVTEIGVAAFLWCDFAINPRLPRNLKRLEYDTFCGSSISWLTLPEQLEYLGEGSLSGCDCLPEIEIPDRVAYIGQYALNSCEGLQKVHLGKSVRHIDRAAFGHCKVLKEIVCPNNLEIISDYAFASCSELDSLTLNEGLLVIGKEAFEKCKKLSLVRIPSTVLSIGTGAFKACDSLVKAFVPESLRCLDISTIFDPHTSVEYYE